MNKFIRTEQFPAWSLVYSCVGQELDIDFDARRESGVMASVFSGKTIGLNLAMLDKFTTNVVQKYDDLVEKYGEILIHENGTFHTERNSVITDVFYGTDFPPNVSNYDVVICENDVNAPDDWIQTLGKHSIGTSINVINYFRTRTIESIKQLFDSAKFITFETTFSDYDWFEMLLECVNPDKHIIIGRCFDDDKITIATKIAADKNINILFIY